MVPELQALLTNYEAMSKRIAILEQVNRLFLGCKWTNAHNKYHIFEIPGVERKVASTVSSGNYDGCGRIWIDRFEHDATYFNYRGQIKQISKNLINWKFLEFGTYFLCSTDRNEYADQSL